MMLRVGQKYYESLSKRTFTIIQITDDQCQVKYSGSGCIHWLNNDHLSGLVPVGIKYTLVSSSYTSPTDKFELTTEIDLENNPNCSNIHEAYLGTFRWYRSRMFSKRQSFKIAIEFAKDAARRHEGPNWKDYFRYVRNYVVTQSF